MGNVPNAFVAERDGSRTYLMDGVKRSCVIAALNIAGYCVPKVVTLTSLNTSKHLNSTDNVGKCDTQYTIAVFKYLFGYSN